MVYLQTRCQKTDIGPMIDGGGVQDRGPIKQTRSKERTCQREAEVGWKAHPGGGEAAFASAYLLEKWDLGSKAGVKMKPNHFRWDCG